MKKWIAGILLGAVILVGLLLSGRNGESWRMDAPFASAFLPHDDERASLTVKLPDVVVGLRDHRGTELYVDAAFDIEVASEEDRLAVRQQLARVRDQTIAFLSELSAEQLRGSDELAKIKVRLLDRYRSAMPGQHLKALYVSYLAIARLE
jgi:flagellar basal body-associated protein FliL